VYVGVIYVAIQVDQSVPELGHLPQFYPFFLLHDAIFFEHFKGIGIVLRCPEMLRRNDVVGNDR